MGKYMLPNTVRLRFVWGILSLVALATMILAACGGGTATTPTPTASQAGPTTAATSPASPTSAAVKISSLVLVCGAKWLKRLEKPLETQRFLI